MPFGDNILSFFINTLEEIRHDMAGRAKKRRLGMNLSQAGLARRAGISTGTIK